MIKKSTLFFIIWGLFFALCIYNALDAYHSYLLFQTGLKEWNSLLNYIGGYFGLMFGIIAFKVIFLGLFAGIIAHVQTKLKNYELKRI